MANDTATSQSKKRPPMSASDKRWFLIWTGITFLSFLALYLYMRYVPGPYEAELKEMSIGQFPRSTERWMSLCRLTTYLFPWAVVFLVGAIAVAGFCRARWPMPIVALIPLLPLVNIQILHSVSSLAIERRIDSYDLALVDEWLAELDGLAKQGRVPRNIAYTNAKHKRAMSHITWALIRRDPHAPSRFVFMGLVASDNPVPARRQIYQEFCSMVGTRLPTFSTIEGSCTEDFFEPAGLFFWYQEDRDKYESFPLLDEWLERESTKNERIPVFEKSRQVSK